jgi:hypothetical protein
MWNFSGEDFYSSLMEATSRAVAIKNSCIQKFSEAKNMALNLAPGAGTASVITYALSELASSTTAGKATAVILGSIIGGISSYFRVKGGKEENLSLSSARKGAVPNAVILGLGVSLLCIAGSMVTEKLLPEKPKCGRISVDVRPNLFARVINNIW